jgi:prepilin-type N-terminal cleavage/methylation domain-containing protein
MNWKSEKGASLVEIMVALLIFGIGVVAAARMLPQSNAKSTHSRNRTIAVNIAQEKNRRIDGGRIRERRPHGRHP